MEQNTSQQQQRKMAAEQMCKASKSVALSGFTFRCSIS